MDRWRGPRVKGLKAPGARAVPGVKSDCLKPCGGGAARGSRTLSGNGVGIRRVRPAEGLRPITVRDGARGRVQFEIASGQRGRFEMDDFLVSAGGKGPDAAEQKRLAQVTGFRTGENRCDGLAQAAPQTLGRGRAGYQGWRRRQIRGAKYARALEGLGPASDRAGRCAWVYRGAGVRRSPGRGAERY